MRECDINITPSVLAPGESESKEGSPAIIQKAAFTGLATITTDATGCQAVVIYQQTGLIVKEKISTVLADVIVELILDPRKHRSLGNAARSIIGDEFDYRTCKIPLLKMVNEVALARS